MADTVGFRLTIEGQREFIQRLEESVEALKRFSEVAEKVAEGTADFSMSAGQAEDSFSKVTSASSEAADSVSKVSDSTEEAQESLSDFGDQSDSIIGILDELAAGQHDVSEATQATTVEVIEAEEAFRDFVDSLDQAAEQQIEANDQAELFRQGLMGLGSAALAATALMGGIAMQVSGTGDEIMKQSRATGLAVDEYQEWVYVMGLAGLEGSFVERLLTRLNQRMGRAALGATRYASAFEELGVEIHDASGGMRETGDVLEDTISSLADLEDGSVRSAVAGELLGTRMGRRMATLMSLTSDEIAGLRAEAHALGLVMDAETAVAAENFRDAMSRLRQEFTAVGREFGVSIMHAMETGFVPLVRNVVIPVTETFFDLMSFGVDAFAAMPEPVQEATLAFAIFGTQVLTATMMVTKLFRATRGLLPTKAALRVLLTTKLVPALALAAVSLSLFTHNLAAARKQQEDFIFDIQVGEGSLKENADAAIANALANEELMNAAEHAGVSIAEMEAAILGEEDARKQLNDTLDDQIGSASNHSQTMRLQSAAAREAQNTVNNLSDALAQHVRETNLAELASMGLREEFGNLDKESQEIILSAADMRQEIKKNEREFYNLHFAVNAAGDAFEDMSLTEILRELEQLPDALSHIERGFRSFIDPSRAVGDALRELQEEERRSLQQTDMTADEISDAVDSIEVSYDRYTEVLRAQIDEQKEWESNLLAIADETTAEVIEHLTAMGLEGASIVAEMANGSIEDFSEIEELVEIMSKTDDNVIGAIDEDAGEMAASASMAAQGIVESFGEELGYGTAQVREILRGYGWEVEQALNPILSSTGADNIRFRSGQFGGGGDANTPGPPSMRFRNEGGPIPGWGADKDSVPAMLTPGEHVWTRREVQAAGGHHAMIRARQMVRTDPHRDLTEILFGGDPSSPGMYYKAYNIGGAVTWARGEHGKPYVWGGVGPGGYDCSGWTSALQNVLEGRSPHSRRHTTHSFQGQPPSGWVKGRGLFEVGVTHAGVGHMSATLAGVPMEARGSAGVVVGAGARPATHPLYSDIFTMPAFSIVVPEPPTSWPGNGLFNSAPSATRYLYDSVTNWVESGAWADTFDSGGWLMPGWTMAYNGTGAPERIVPPDDETGGGTARGATVTIENMVINANNGEEVFEQFKRRIERERLLL